MSTVYSESNMVGVHSIPQVVSNSSSGYFTRPPTPTIHGSRLRGISDDGTIDMVNNTIHIQTANNGFILTAIVDHEASIYTFTAFEDVVGFLKDNPLMDLNSILIAENI